MHATTSLLSSWAALVVLILGSGCRPRVRYPDVAVATPEEPVVQLRRADVVLPIGEHYYFVHFDPDQDATWHRTELFARIRDGRRILTDRFEPDASFDARGLRPARLVREYRGPRARRLLDAIDTSRVEYPFEDRYVLSGPNSNTYIAWVLREAHVGHDFTTRAIGRRLPTRVGLSDSRTGVALHTPILGIELGLTDGIELSFGPATFGIDLFPPALKTPAGRIGVPQPAIRTGPPAGERRRTIRQVEDDVLHDLGVTRESMQPKFESPRKFRKWLRYSARQRLHDEDAPPPSTVGPD